MYKLPPQLPPRRTLGYAKAPHRRRTIRANDVQVRTGRPVLPSRTDIDLMLRACLPLSQASLPLQGEGSACWEDCPFLEHKSGTVSTWECSSRARCSASTRYSLPIRVNPLRPHTRASDTGDPRYIREALGWREEGQSSGSGSSSRSGSSAGAERTRLPSAFLGLAA